MMSWVLLVSRRCHVANADECRLASSSLVDWQTVLQPPCLPGYPLVSHQQLLQAAVLEIEQAACQLLRWVVSNIAGKLRVHARCRQTHAALQRQPTNEPPWCQPVIAEHEDIVERHRKRVCHTAEPQHRHIWLHSVDSEQLWFLLKCVQHLLLAKLLQTARRQRKS